MKLLALWALLLLQAASVTGWKGSNQHVGREAKQKHDAVRDGQHQQPIQAVVDEVNDHPEVQQEGDDLVEAARVELDRIPKWSYQRTAQSTSIFVRALGYILHAIPTGPTTAPADGQSTQSPGIKGPLLNAVRYLEQAAGKNNSDALYMLADFNFYGNYTHPRDLNKAFEHYKELAINHGNSTSQYMLGLYYSTGLGGVVARDQALALLYYTFAAVKGEIRAEMAVAFRHHSGIGAPKSCETAVKHYKRVADKAMDWYLSGPPGGMSWVQQAWRIADDDGGLFGEGASASSAGIYARKASPHYDASIGDVMEYLDFLSRKGDWPATLDLGKRYYEGRRGLAQDFDMAKKYFFLVASKQWRRDGRIVDNPKPDIVPVAGRAAGYIGRMYMRGDGLRQNFDRARIWFERGVAHGDALSQYGLGLMLLNGYGGKKNTKQAVQLIRVAAEGEYAPAHVQMGRLYLDQGSPEDIRVANSHFEFAARFGNIEAAYYVAELVHNGVGRDNLCGTAISYYKMVAEKAEPLVSPWADANDAFRAGDYEAALLGYLMAAEQGYEKAQTNVGWMLDTVQSKLPLPSLFKSSAPRAPLLDNPEMALIYWTRSSRQSNIDSLVKMGDYYLNGIGSEPDINKAVQCYTGASDYSQSAQAIFNLGWMHENGVGLTQDFHLAKRYYDHALEVNQEAYLPVTLSLLKLRLRSAWNTFTNGPIHSIQEEPEKKRDWTLSEWIASFLAPEPYEYEEFYADSMYDGTIEAGDEIDDAGVIESLLIVGITTLLIFLLWWRQRIQQAHAQAEEARRREQGLPPHQPAHGAQAAAGADGFRGWAAGGLGL